MENITTKEILSRVDFLAPLESQKEYRQEIASFIRMHLTRIKAIENGVKPHSLPLVSMLVIAETGCGKTYVASQMAKASGVNFITIDCSTLARAGWKGVNLANAIQSEREKCGNKRNFDRSIIMFDEADKLRFIPYRSDEGNPQPNFLRMFDGELQAESKNGNMENIDTSKMSFIFAGAFANGLAEIVKERLTPRRTIGFSADHTLQLDGNVLKYATFQDIQDYGIMGELCGRIGSLIYLPPLTNTDYRTLIKGTQGSALMRYKNLFGAMGIDVDVTDEVCDYIAEKASKSGLGARSINSALFLNFQKAHEAIEEHTDINKVVLELQDENLPGLCFEFGERNVVEPEKTGLGYKVKFPDVNFSFELGNDQQTLGFIRYLMDAHALTMSKNTDIDDRLLLRAFLACAMCYLRDNSPPKDMTLSSLEKLAVTTKKKPLEASTFEMIIGRAITDYEESKHDSEEEEEEGEESELEKKYHNFRSRFKVGSHEFLIDAVQEIRRNWYKYLMDSIGDKTRE